MSFPGGFAGTPGRGEPPKDIVMNLKPLRLKEEDDA